MECCSRASKRGRFLWYRVTVASFLRVVRISRFSSKSTSVCFRVSRFKDYTNSLITQESTLLWFLLLRKDRCFCFVGRRVQGAWSLRWVYVLFLFKLDLHEGSRLDEGDTIGMLVLEGRVLEVLLRFDDLNWEVNRK